MLASVVGESPQQVFAAILVTPDSPVEAWSIASAVIRGQRDQLIRFWLACPDDALDGLWNSPAGQATREMVAQLSPTTFFSEQQVALRNRLGEVLQQGFQQPGAIKAVIATFLLSPPGQFRIVNPESHLPSWLVPSYRSLYEQGQAQPMMAPPAPTLAPAPAPAPPSIAASLPTPDFGPFPASLAELVANRLQLNRLLGLSNLYYIDPDDQEIRDELLQLRQQLAQLLLQADEAALEQHFAGDFGDRYWALVRSGIQSVPLDSAMAQLKVQVKQRLTPSAGGGFGRPGAVPAFLVAMMLYEPGSMQVEGAEQKLPAWLLSGYQQVFAQALKS